MATTKEDLHALVDRLTNDQAQELLEYARWLLGEEDDRLSADDLAAVKRGLADIRAGRVRPWEEVRRTLGR
ncbi:hypothetical protein [Caldinitratiruptor microaerophilus]|uniref:Addiction module component n=1 Tax=Caldinitratiruptor microaerophilus TaxID=671077 RepID=A0AA35G5P0_9FIRM|nr:hypothetical protein [Caldinitratiruptor microaerophilus]BDG59806.1 hypothetical protein caldi_08960 [Caldinitratiruptor microaerophilus]